VVCRLRDTEDVHFDFYAHDRAFLGVYGWATDGRRDHDDRTLYFNASGTYSWPSSVLSPDTVYHNPLDSFTKEPRSIYNLLRHLNVENCPALNSKPNYDDKR